MQKITVRKGLVLGIMVLFIGASVTSSMGTAAVDKQDSTDNRTHDMGFNSGGDILYVGGSGPGNYSTIQSAIDAASDGDTVYVYSGTYSEDISIGKQITLQGENKESTVVNGEISIFASPVTIREFTIQNDPVPGTIGIRVPTGTGYHTITENIITNNWIGISLSSSSDNNNIFQNTFINNQEGIRLTQSSNNIISGNTVIDSYRGIIISDSSDNNLVSDNTFENNEADGIEISGSYFNDIRENFITNSNNGIVSFPSHDSHIFDNTIIDCDYGIILIDSPYNDIQGNTIKDCTNDGIKLQSSSHNNIEGNNVIDNNNIGIGLYYSINNNLRSSIISNNTKGIYFYDGSSNNVIEENTIENNNKGINFEQYYGSSNDNLIYHNYFIDNVQNAEDKYNNQWDNGYPSGGNYWDDYTGVDSNGDGIGDVPYNIPGGSNQDLYPLMNPYGSITNLDTGEIFITIQGAIDDSDTLEGHTIYVRNGTYYENVDITKNGINLMGENKETTIIDSKNGYGNGIYIKNHDYISVSGFTIKSAQTNDPYYSGHGVLIYTQSYSSGAHSNYNIISDCIICNNTYDGIVIDVVDVGQNSNNNLISNCEIYDNGRRGILICSDQDGGGWSYAKHNQILNCKIYNNGNDGITISPEGEVSDTLISNCEFYDNYGYGIFINERGGIADNNIIYHNNFLNETDNAYDECTNFWYNATLQEGNYWSDYTGEDNNGDGIGDTPYDVPGASGAQDLYPLMYLYGWNDDTIEVFANPSVVLLGITTTLTITVFRNGEPYEGAWVSLIGLGIELGNSTLPDGTTTFSIIPASTGTISIKVNYVITNTTIEVVAWVPTEVYVDDDYNESTPGWGYDHFDSIQEGVDAVFENGAVFVFNGIYDENILINKTIDLIGENKESTIVTRIQIENTEYVNVSDFYLGPYYVQHNFIYVVNSPNTSVTDCIVDGSGNPGPETHGIGISGEYVHIADNIIRNLDYQGIFGNFRYCTLFNNTIYNMGANGMHIEGDCHHNTICQNEISNTGLWAIRLRISSVTENYIYHNNFLGETCYDQGSSNHWDNGYPSGGNYWSVYSGDDNFHGPNQDIPGSDGIGDTPYYFSGGQDNYPYMDQDGWLIPPIPDIVYIDDDYNESTPGWGYDHFDSIQDGINSVAENGTVNVYNGTYYENVVVDKTVSLIGEDKNSTIIDGGGSEDTIHIFEKYVNISQFTITGSGDNYWEDAGVDIEFSNNSLFDNIIQDNRNGIRISGSFDNIIERNTVINNLDDGIRLHDSFDNIIERNTVINNQDEGIELLSGSFDNIIERNTVINNQEDGIWLHDSSDNIITGNTVTSSNCNGIRISHSSDNNVFYHNNIINNIDNANDDGTNSWYNVTLQEGNYYSDYNGEDADGDGIGDTPYNISGGSNQDMYPLMYQYGWNDDTIEVFAYPSEILFNRPATVEITVFRNGEPYEGAWVSLIIPGLSGELGNLTLPDGTVTFSFVPPSTGTIEIKINYVTTNTTIEVVAWIPTEVYVDDDYNESTPGWGYDHFDSIQDGVDAVDEGGTVYVYNGTYYENVDITKNGINLMGENKDNTIIDGSSTFYQSGIYTEASGVNIQGFTITNFDGSGISLWESNNCSISNNILTENTDGIYISYYSYDCYAHNNIISSNTGYGIEIHHSSNVSIKENIIFNNNMSGIMLYQSCNNNITSNEISDNHEGIWLMYWCDNNTIFNNTVYSNTDEGITLYEYCHGNSIINNSVYSNSNNGIELYFSSRTTVLDNKIYDGEIVLSLFNSSNDIISGNTISNGTYGIKMRGAKENNISNNNIFSNSNRGIYAYYNSDDNNFYHNTLVNNTVNARDICNNIWDDGYPSGGNYWDDYNGNDTDGDHIGDTPYNISGGSNQDLYPLMNPYGPPHADFIYTINDRTVYVNASTSYDYDGIITNYEWLFGDGSGGNGPIEAHVYPDYGTYNVTLTVTDNDGINDTKVEPITLEDNISPEITDNTPNFGYTGDSFTFNATITDAGGIDTAWVTWWYDSTALSVELNYIGNDNYEKTITIQDTLETLSYYISANDTSDNWQYTNTSYVTIYDNDKPEISDVQANPSIQSIGGYVNVSATVIDNIEVDEVYLYILYPDMTVENLSITQYNIDDTYYCNKTYDVPGVYTYHIWANDTSGNSNISSDYTFEIINQPPYTPHDPDPENGSTGVSIYVDLSWVGGDPDLDPVDYDVYFGTASPPPKVVSNQSSTIYNPGTLEYDTTYYWKIVAWDNHDAFAEGPVWNFTTEEEYIPEPDLYCEGSLYWDGVISGEPVTGSFLLFNVGDPSSFLDWEIVDWPEWGTWAFTPDSGEDLTPEDGAVTVTVFVDAPDEPDTEFIGEVRIVNTENSDDYYVIPVYLRTPVSQDSTSSQILFYQSYIEKLMFIIGA